MHSLEVLASVLSQTDAYSQSDVFLLQLLYTPFCSQFVTVSSATLSELGWNITLCALLKFSNHGGSQCRINSEQPRHIYSIQLTALSHVAVWTDRRPRTLMVNWAVWPDNHAQPKNWHIAVKLRKDTKCWLCLTHRHRTEQAESVPDGVSLLREGLHLISLTEPLARPLWA